MNTKSQENSLFKNQILKWGIILLILFSLIFIFKNTLFKSSLALKSYGAISMDPEEAFHNNKPTFLEFYADWCEVCQEMAPSIINLRDDYQNDINFVFLNVDNPKWAKLVKKYNVNGIPQINLIDSNTKLITTLTGLQEENSLRSSIEYLIANEKEIKEL